MEKYPIPREIPQAAEGRDHQGNWRVVSLIFHVVLPIMFLATMDGGEFFGNVGCFEAVYECDAVVLDDSILSHPQTLDLAERMERAVYLGLDWKQIIEEEHRDHA